MINEYLWDRPVSLIDEEIISFLLANMDAEIK